MPTDLTTDLATQAVEPLVESADGTSTTGRSTADMIAAQQFLDAKTALRKRRRGITYTKLVTPGPLSDEGGRGCSGGFGTPCGGC